MDAVSYGKEVFAKKKKYLPALPRACGTDPQGSLRKDRLLIGKPAGENGTE